MLEQILRGVTAIPDELKELDNDIEEIDEEQHLEVNNEEEEDDTDTTDSDGSEE